jgi:hypothetical protein
MSARRLPPLATSALLGLALGCAGEPDTLPPYLHNRDDYFAFRDAHPGLLEPNYLPFMVYEVPARPESAWSRLAQRLGLAAAGERRLVLCHWRPEDMPLSVWIEPPLGLDGFDEDPSPPAP